MWDSMDEELLLFRVRRTRKEDFSQKWELFARSVGETLSVEDISAVSSGAKALPAKPAAVEASARKAKGAAAAPRAKGAAAASKAKGAAAASSSAGTPVSGKRTPPPLRSPPKSKKSKKSTELVEAEDARSVYNEVIQRADTIKRKVASTWDWAKTPAMAGVLESKLDVVSKEVSKVGSIGDDFLAKVPEEDLQEQYGSQAVVEMCVRFKGIVQDACTALDAHCDTMTSMNKMYAQSRVVAPVAS